MKTHLRFLCESCNEEARIHKVLVTCEMVIIIAGDCQTCDIVFYRSYDLCEVIVSQEEAA